MARKPAKRGSAKKRTTRAVPKKRKPALKKARARRATPSKTPRLHQVALKATDLDASIAFYRDVVGLTFIARFDPPGIAFFDTGGPRLYLAAALPEGTFYYLVPDLDAAVAGLEGRGVSFFQKPTMLHRDNAGQFGKKGVEEWMAFFRDPSGNTVAFVERR